MSLTIAKWRRIIAHGSLALLAVAVVAFTATWQIDPYVFGFTVLSVAGLQAVIAAAEIVALLWPVAPRPWWGAARAVAHLVVAGTALQYLESIHWA